jgi:hypothetical protein
MLSEFRLISGCGVAPATDKSQDRKQADNQYRFPSHKPSFSASIYIHCGSDATTKEQLPHPYHKVEEQDLFSVLLYVTDEERELVRDKRVLDREGGREEPLARKPVGPRRRGHKNYNH